MVQPAHRLLDLWRERIHPAASQERVAIAFALVAGGAVLAVLGVLLVALGDLALPRPSWIRELGFVAAAAGLPLFLAGFVVALPSRRWLLALSGGGVLAAGFGVVLFALWYPDQWYLTVRAPNAYAIGAYLAGVSALAAAATAELAAYFVQSAGGTAQGEAGDRPVTDEEIAADLAWADEQGWDWGGVRAGRPDVNIRLKDETPLRFRGRGKRVHKEATSSEPDVMAAQKLYQLRGKKRDNTDSDVDAQVSYLRELKAQREAERRAERDSLWWKLTHPVQWLKG